MQTAQLISTILQTISVFVAAVSLTLGANAWRRSFLGQKKIELAEETLEDFYLARDAISSIRNPLSLSSEGKTRARRKNESPEESEILDRAFIVVERHEKHSELFSRLDSKKYRFSIYFGSEQKELFNELRRIRMKVLQSSARLSKYWIDQGRRNFSEEQFKDHLTKMQEAEAIFWEGGGPDGIDPILKDLEPLIEKVETVCKKEIGRAS